MQRTSQQGVQMSFKDKWMDILISREQELRRTVGLARAVKSENLWFYEQLLEENTDLQEIAFSHHDRYRMTRNS